MAEEYVQILIVHSLTLMVLLLTCYRHVNATESPPYAVLLSSPDLEIRLYRDSTWISAAVAGGTSFNNSTHDGFHRLYQYIHGGNENNAIFKITTPTVTTAASSSDVSPDYSVSMYMASISRPIPMPSPQLNLQISNWKSRCIAVRRFSGFAGDDNIYTERSLLSISLANKSSIFNGKNVSISEDKSSYSVAQYNASSHLSGRVNEVWINVIPCPFRH